jgi:hypothetical protein
LLPDKKSIQMIIRNSSSMYLALTVILISVFLSCNELKTQNGSGILKGKISIGPLCPVETIPPAPGCLPTKETYKAWAIAVWTLNKKSKIIILDPNLDGVFQIGLPAGDYMLDFDAAQSGRIGGSNLPALFSIADLDTTIVNINIDTGIR